jgi:hypothetical protein
VNAYGDTRKANDFLGKADGDIAVFLDDHVEKVEHDVGRRFDDVAPSSRTVASVNFSYPVGAALSRASVTTLLVSDPKS